MTVVPCTWTNDSPFVSRFEAVVNILCSLGLQRKSIECGSILPWEIEDIFTAYGAGSPKNILEIGSFVGTSACVIALLSGPKANIVSVDPSFPLRIQLGLNHPLSDVPCLDVARKLATQLKLSEHTTFIQGYFSCAPTPELASRLESVNIQSGSVKIVASDCERRGPYDLIVIDGEHSAEAVQSDLVTASRMLAAGGLIALHDLAGKWGPYVQAGIEGFCGSGTCWKLEVKENVGFIRAR